MNRILVFAFLFFIGSGIGWVIELLFRKFMSKNNPGKRWINPGFLVGPCLPIYGFGLWGMYFVSIAVSSVLGINPIADAAVVLVTMGATMTAIEYAAGLIFIKGMKVKLWDYSRERFNLQGIICPKFSLAWGVLGCVYYFAINPYVMGWVEWLSYHLTFSFFIGTAFGIFLIDVSYSIQLVTVMKRFAEEKQIIIKYEELKEHMREQREELEEKARFILAFKTDAPLKEHLEAYLEKKLSQKIDRLQQLGGNIGNKN